MLMSKYWDTGFYSQPSAAEIKRNSVESRKCEEKKGKSLEPVQVTGRQIVKNWWGKAW